MDNNLYICKIKIHGQWVISYEFVLGRIDRGLSSCITNSCVDVFQ